MVFGDVLARHVVRQLLQEQHELEHEGALPAGETVTFALISVGLVSRA